MSEKVRVHEIAKELGIASKDVVKKASEVGIEIKSASSSVSMEEAESLMNYIMNGEVVHAPVVEIKKDIKPSSDTQKEEKAPQKETKESQANVAPKSSETPLKKVEKEESFSRKIEVEPKPAAQETKAMEEDDDEAEEPADAMKMQIKKSGLKIVKKKQPKAEEKPQEAVSSPKQTPTAISSYGKISAEVLEELAKKKKPKVASSGAAKKQEQGVKIDIFGGSLAEVSMDMDDQIVLLDLNVTERREIIADEPKKAKLPKPMGRNSNKTSAPKSKNVSRDKRKTYRKEKAEDVAITHVEIPEDIRVYEFAEKVNKTLADVIKVLFSFGVMKMKNDFLSKDEIEILSEEFGIEVTTVDPKDAFNYEEDLAEAIDDNATERPPVITIMGHVDHGKTSLLDAIRNAKVTQGEAGGITQHIGAYTIEQHGKPITFLDTPGHAAFSQMRQRGTDVTDIVIIVVAADDGVKPQTDEVIKLAKESKVPIIVALNKMDKESANPDMVKAQMAERGLNPIDWGGDIEFIPISAKTGMGIDDLLENILITAEVLELKANENAMAKAAVVESSLEKGRGPVATVIVQNGTLKVGDYVVCGSAYGRVKALINEHKQQIKSIKPSHTAVVVGLNEVPSSGEVMMAMASDKEAREYAMKRHEYDRHRELSLSTKSTLEDMTSMIAEGRLKTLKIVLKTDVHGSLEAIRGALSELRNDEVKINIISSGVGGITENDVELVANSENCVLLGFNVRPTGSVKALAKQKNVDIKTYSIIYQLLDDMTGMLTGMMAPKFSEINTGQADVRNVFKAPKGLVAGCVVVDGKLIRGGLVRVIRNGVVVHEGELTSLKRFKDDVEEVTNGYECGVMIKGYDDVMVGDVIETFKKVEQKVSL
ncbi:MAG: translation initiation factor IF-2 [Sulfurimonas sp.]|uniref:translation initiation factor IF-2 n=1 Tax=Sulfurimonas sp. TaxID=2022749 RepID=UPI00262EA94F|nr:translation initiation factor IF-2 [Sulfurimonas sp.]MDD2651573.1 translation initiation factor IF-2 [Sulfurimonas sp.]MDD3451384.1 translation initiation factor IF-2 [Sulfurimonas sp.]